MALSHQSTQSNTTATLPHHNPVPLISKIMAPLLWIACLCALGLLITYAITQPSWQFIGIFNITGFTLLIWVTVTFFSAIVSAYSKTYLVGFKYHARFSSLCLGFTAAVLVFVMSNHILPFLLCWLLMGVFMAQLIGVDTRWGEAREASRFAQRFFLGSALSLSIGIILLAYHTNQFTITGIMDNLSVVSQPVLISAALLIIIAAIIQSAIYPFHRWLLSAMTSPTPASALMHAGFVNGAGILLAFVASLLIASNMLTVLFIIGGLTAVLAQFTKLLQVNVKQKLACSTIAQMGFMIMQCGLGFFNAAVAHLILHGFYKAYLFLSSGEEIAYTAPHKAHKITIKPLQALIVLVFGLAGAALFTLLTGKTSLTDSSVFLTLIVAITVGQVTYNIVKQASFTTIQKALVPIALFVTGIVLYALIYNGVTYFMAAMPMIATPQPLSAIQIGFGIIFLIGFFIMKLGIYRQVPWLYVRLLNISQPSAQTILKYKKVN